MVPERWWRKKRPLDTKPVFNEVAFKLYQEPITGKIRVYGDGIPDIKPETFITFELKGFRIQIQDTLTGITVDIMAV